MSLWWLQPGWTETRCSCGAKIWPEGDPDWGACFQCFSAQLAEQHSPQYLGVDFGKEPGVTVCNLCGGTGTDPNTLNDPGPCPQCDVRFDPARDPGNWPENIR